MAVGRNLIGSTAEWGDEGFVIRERISVPGLNEANFAESIYDAFLQAPARGSTRVLGTNPNDITMYCSDRRLETVQNEGGGTALAILTLEWRQQIPNTVVFVQTPDDDGDVVVTVGTIVDVVETEFDRLGAEIKVKRDANSPEIIQPVSYRRPRPIIECSRWESSNPRTRSETYVGKINSATWNGYAAETVLCTSIVGTSRDNGDTYDVRYEFEVRTGGWDTTVVYIDENTGRPLAGLVEGTSKKSDIELYEPVSFDGLNISL